MKKLVLGSLLVMAALTAFALPAGAATDGGPPTGAASASLEPPSSADRDFLIAAARVALAEILQGVVASQRGVDPEVREYGSHMVRDHFTQIFQQLPIHLVYGVPVPATTPEQDTQLAVLASTPEAEFDEAYLTAQVAAHTEALALFTTAAAEADNVFVAAFAEQQVPVLEMHLAHATELLAGMADGAVPVGALTS